MQQTRQLDVNEYEQEQIRAVEIFKSADGVQTPAMFSLPLDRHITKKLLLTGKGSWLVG